MATLGLSFEKKANSEAEGVEGKQFGLLRRSEGCVDAAAHRRVVRR
jgi:hypothetical protein